MFSTTNIFYVACNVYGQRGGGWSFPDRYYRPDKYCLVQPSINPNFGANFPTGGNLSAAACESYWFIIVSIIIIIIIIIISGKMTEDCPAVLLHWSMFVVIVAAESDLCCIGVGAGGGTGG